MESKVNYTYVGFMVIILVIGLLAATIWLSTGFDSKNYNLFTVYVTEAISGLNDDSVVKYNGVKVGFVNKIELNEYDPQQVKIQLKIVEGTPITSTTHATLINQGITGTVYLGLSASSPSLFPLQKTPGEKYPVIPYKPSFLSQLEQNISDISNSVKRIFDKENSTAFKKSLANLQAITDVIAQNKNSLNQSFKDLPKLISDLKIGANKFSSMSTSMSSAGKSVSSTMLSGKNTIDKISQQTLPPIVAILQRLELITANLEKVSAQMRENPSVIIRGSAPPKSGPGE